MAQENLDLFMTIKRADGMPLKGESIDRAFGSTPRPATDDDDGEPHFAIELDSFEVSFEEAGKMGEKKDAKKGNKKSKAETNGAKSKSSDHLGKTPEQKKSVDSLRRREELFESLTKQLENFEDSRIVVARTFRVKKGLDTASPGLFLAYCEGMPRSKRSGPQPDTKFSEVVVMARKAGSADKPFLKVTFNAVKVDSYSLNMDGPVPSESVGFEFEAVLIEYARQAASGELDEYVMAEGAFHMAAEDES